MWPSQTHRHFSLSACTICPQLLAYVPRLRGIHRVLLLSFSLRLFTPSFSQTSATLLSTQLVVYQQLFLFMLVFVRCVSQVL